MIHALLKCDRGNSLIELGFALPVLVTLLVGMVDLSSAVSDKLHLVQVSQRTVERVQRSGFQYADIATLETEAEAAAGPGSNATVAAWLECGSSSARLSFTSSCTAGQAYARFVGVSITKDFTPMFSTEYFPGANSNGTFTLQGTAGVRIQ